MATDTKSKNTEKVEIFIPAAGANEDPNLLIGINGRNYVLPKGKMTKVPPEVAEEYKRSLLAQQTADENRAALLEMSKDPTNVKV